MFNSKGKESESSDRLKRRWSVTLNDIERRMAASGGSGSRDLEQHNAQQGSSAMSVATHLSDDAVLNSNRDSVLDELRPSMSYSPITDSDNELERFAQDIPFTLTINETHYLNLAMDPTRRIPYLPVPLKPLRGIPAITAVLEFPITQLMDADSFKDTIDNILHVYGYTFTHERAERVYVNYTHRNGTRQRMGVRLENAPLIINPWVMEVFWGNLDCVASNCTCEECTSKPREEGSYGHGIVIEVAFPQGFEKYRKPTESPPPEEVVEYWAGKPKKPFGRAMANPKTGG